MLTLPVLPNLHLQREHAAAVEPTPAISPAAAEPADAGKLLRVTRSPAEELAARAQKWGQTDQVPDALLAMICAEVRAIDVKPNGITFDFENKTYRFWCADSSTCHPSNVGKKARFVFTRHDLTKIYVVDDAGTHVETVPLATSPAFFDKQMEQERAATQRVINHVHQSLKDTHRLTTAADSVPNRENREKLQFAGDFIVKGVQAEAPASMPHAEAINDRLRHDAQEKATEAAARGRAGKVDLVEFTNRRAARARKREAAAAVPAFDRT